MSLLQKYVSDMKDDGTYTLSLDERETRALWAEIGALENELTVLRFRLSRYETINPQPAAGG
jgi:hypothetical protein